MVAKIHNKNVIVICDCIGCQNKPTWMQGFFTRQGMIIVDLCEDHHFILRTKVPGNIELNDDVLKWLLIQDSNPDKVFEYGTIKSTADLEFLKELDKIEIELE